MPAPRNESSRAVCDVACGELLEMAHELGLGERRRHVELAAEADAGGICSNSSSIDETPIAASISSRSASVRER